MSKKTSMNSTPFIPDEVFEKLPEPFPTMLKRYTDKRKRDMAFLSMIVAGGGSIRNVKCIYGDDEIEPNLYFLALAPPASGKSVVSHAQYIVPTKTFMQSFYDVPGESDERAVETYNRITMLIPADTTAASLVETLKANNGYGIVNDSEADTHMVSNRSDHGQFSHLYRKAWHNEPIEVSRLKRGIIRIERPVLGLSFAGTPGQLKGLIESVENGLFSRFMFYTFSRKGEVRWQNPFDNSGISARQELEQHREFFELIYTMLRDLDKPILFELSPSQQERYGKFMDDLLVKMQDRWSVIPEESILRLGNIGVRIGLILAVVRLFDDCDHLPDTLILDEEDYNTVTALIEVLLQHALTVFEMASEFNVVNDEERLFSALKPLEKFSYSQAIEKAKEINIGKHDRTIRRYLNSWTEEGRIKHLRHNNYSI